MLIPERFSNFTRQESKLDCVSCIRVGVTLQRPAVEQEGGEADDAEDDDGLNDHGGRIQHRVLGIGRHHLFLGHQAVLVRLHRRLGVGEGEPLVQVLGEEDDGDEEDSHQLEGAAHRLQRTAEEQSPLAAGDILQHQHAVATAGEAEGDHKAHQVGAHEVVASLVAPREGEDRDDGSECTDDQQTHPARALIGSSGAASDAGRTFGPCPCPSP
ncbi:MAG: hypothetical protein PW789_19060 [Edaphobacter sp.]|uniref:hypothetical protein n=1 Tax=Edaphobacter sp. TaxID=1934404 RepID=UPI0023907303|nr:hypothetical protein [Edaphobacter sp.]MDE1178680.1 hypothetical protein [Edaphobacter sp.]